MQEHLTIAQATAQQAHQAASAAAADAAAAKKAAQEAVQQLQVLQAPATLQQQPGEIVLLDASTLPCQHCHALQ